MWQVTAPQVSIVSGASMSVMWVKSIKKMSVSSQKERQRSWIEALDQNNTQGRIISEENVLPPKL